MSSSLSPYQLPESKRDLCFCKRYQWYLRNSRFTYPTLRMFDVSQVLKEVFWENKIRVGVIPRGNCRIRRVYLWTVNLRQPGLALPFLPLEHRSWRGCGSRGSRTPCTWALDTMHVLENKQMCCLVETPRAGVWQWLFPCILLKMFKDPTTLTPVPFTWMPPCV